MRLTGYGACADMLATHPKIYYQMPCTHPATSCWSHVSLPVRPSTCVVPRSVGVLHCDIRLDNFVCNEEGGVVKAVDLERATLFTPGDADKHALTEAELRRVDEL